MDTSIPNSAPVKLDVDAEHFLAVFQERAEKHLGDKKLSDLTPEQARKVIAKLLAPDPDESRIPLPEFDVAVGNSSLKYEHNNGTIKVPFRIYAPKGHDEDLPVIMYFHGGGFALGDDALIDFGCQYLAHNLTCRVISVDYRKSPEYKFPSAHHDAYFSTLYVAENPKEFKSNGVLAVAGDSAGGNLATSVCHLAKAEKKFQVVFQLLFYPWVDLNNDAPSDMKFARGYYLELDTLNWMTNMYVATADDKNNPLASPQLRTDFSGLPPALIMIGEADPIYDDAKVYFEKLQKAGTPAEFKEWPGILHDYCALPSFYRCTQESFKLAADTMRKYLK